MIWFEAEQILAYLQNLELKLDEWSLCPLDMRIEKAEMERLVRRLEQSKPENPIQAEYAHQLAGRINSMKKCLEERLKR